MASDAAGALVHSPRDTVRYPPATGHHLIDHARAEKTGRIEGLLSDNDQMLAMCRKIGFRIEVHPDEPGTMKVTLDRSAELLRKANNRLSIRRP